MLTLQAHVQSPPVDDHPARAAMEAEAKAKAKAARDAELRAEFEARKRKYHNMSGGDE